MAKSTATTKIDMALQDDSNYWKNVCGLGKGSDCCKYLVCGAKGFECMKEDPDNKRIIDDNWKQIEHVAQGDNCKGYKFK